MERAFIQITNPCVKEKTYFIYIIFKILVSRITGSLEYNKVDKGAMKIDVTQFVEWGMVREMFREIANGEVNGIY
ncbi:hypothetical protein HNV12_12500 [Methanococcoides sp. SA1]|nr:hypothetical protein [Methanococcoides sp. SA1]